jgi:hypothetical protein
MAHKIEYKEEIVGKLETSHRARRPFVGVFIKKYSPIFFIIGFYFNSFSTTFKTNVF